MQEHAAHVVAMALMIMVVMMASIATLAMTMGMRAMLAMVRLEMVIGCEAVARRHWRRHRILLQRGDGGVDC